MALDVVPAGSFSPPFGGDVGAEARMYDSLTPRKGDVTDADVAAGFKPAQLGFPQGERPRRVERPKTGVLIRRDQFNVPYVTAATDADAVWGVGYVAASHAPLLYDVARRNGRLAVLQVPFTSAFGTSRDFDLLEPTAATEAVLSAQVRELQSSGPEGRAVIADIDAWVAGYNARLDATLSPLPRWTRLDLVAMAGFKNNWWGRGYTGGWELLYGEPESQVPAMTSVADSGAVRDEHGLEDYKPERAALASNFALVSEDRSATGHPLLIGGPQIGYLYPAVAFEVDIESPNIHMRGLTAPSVPGYVFIGRGQDFAWTMNVAPVQTGSLVPVTMCDDGQGYLVEGDCRAVENVRVGKTFNLLNPFQAQQPVTMQRTIYGPLTTVVERDGQQIGVVDQYPAAGHDLDDLVGFREVNHGQTDGPDEFRRALQQSPQAFNVGYVDSTHISAFLTCWCVDGETFTTPTTDQLGAVIPTEDLPRTVDPDNGVVTNWNETLRTSADGDFMPPEPDEFRRDWFDAFNSVPVHTTASLVGAMNAQATKDADTSYRLSFEDLFPALGGARPPDIAYTDRSTGIQLVMSFR